MTLIAVKDVETPWSRLADTQHVTSWPVRRARTNKSVFSSLFYLKNFLVFVHHFAELN